MPILQQQDQETVRQRFRIELKRDVNMTLFTQSGLGGLYIPGRECPTCQPTQQILEEVTSLSERLHLEVVDFYSDQQRARDLGIDRIPALVISGNGKGRVRYFGMPSGYEFSVLLDTIVASASKQSTLKMETRRHLKQLKEDVHIQVFVTPT